MKRTTFLLFMLVFMSISSFANEPVEIAGLKKLLDKYQVGGSLLIYDQNKNLYTGYNLQRCNTGFCPASTFKIPNSLIALETKTITPEYIFKWNGEKRDFPSWEKDMNIAEAFKVSNVAVYQDIARRIGTEKMNCYLRLFNYGNMDVNDANIDKFWLEGSSNITQYQQMYFLQKLYRLELPISDKVMKEVKEMMLYESGDGYKISGKTGLSVRQKEKAGWFVGFVETNGNVYYFVTNVVDDSGMSNDLFGKSRIELTKDVLRELKIIEAK